MTSPRGLLAVSVIIDVGKTTSTELRRLTVASQSITFKGQKANLTDFQPAALLPKTTHYVTYEGSLTFPGCHETVTWVILNNPIYITNDDVSLD
uniref:Alpha-carbonic anhydrase domain-containing protein n=2 Tax=Caenorhabditis japonica TaxID=281687 RepID=A0A8R1IKN6_CAEJA